MKEHPFSSWGVFLKKNREKIYRSAREFCQKIKIGISYPQYSRYESGEQLPSLEQVLRLCRYLEIPLSEGFMEWGIAQVKDPLLHSELNSQLVNFRLMHTEEKAVKVKDTELESQTIPLDNVIVFNRSHLELFSSDPMYRDIFTYINSFYPALISAQELASALELPLERVEEMVHHLQKIGVIITQNGKFQVSKPLLYFPDDLEFFDLRNQNLSHNFNAIVRRLKHSDILGQKAFRGLYSRELSTEQLSFLIQKLEEIGNQVMRLPETDHPEAVYSLCLLLGSRFSRPQTVLP